MKRALILGVLLSVILPNAVFGATVNIGERDVTTISLPTVDKSSVRIIALANGSAEIVAALGMGGNLIGRDIASTAPSVEKVPIITAGHQILAEKVIALKPDLVIIDSASGPASAIALIKKSGIKVVKVSEAWNLKDIYRKVSEISVAVGRSELGSQLVAKMKSSVSKLNLNWKPKVMFLYLRGTSSIYLIGGAKSGADSLIAAVGGVDVGAAKLKNPFNTLTPEAVVAANPDIFLVMSKGLQSVGGESGFLKLPGVAQTKAGKAKRIVAVDDSLLLSFGPRTPDLLVKLNQAFRGLK